MKHKRYAFTVIELLAAIAIAGLLMVAVMQVIGTLGRTAKLVDASIDTKQTWARIFKDQLERDLAHVDEVEFKQGILMLETLGGYDPESLAWQYIPSTILYHVVERSEVNVLMREQVFQVEEYSGDKLKQVVAIGVEKWNVELEKSDDDKQVEDILLELKVTGYDEILEISVDILGDMGRGET